MTSVSIKEDRMETTLTTIDSGVGLIRIPPPAGDDYTDISDWNFKETVWNGRLRVIETERIAVGEEAIDDRELIKGVIELENFDRRLFAVIIYDAIGENVRVTTSKKAYRVLIEHSGKKIGFGLIFSDSSLAQEFSISLQQIRKHAEEAIAGQQDYTAELTRNFNNLGIEQDNGPFVLTNDRADKQGVVEDEEADDDFGDFVKS